MKYKKLPNEKIIFGKTDNFTLTTFQESNNLNDWPRSHGNHSSNRFSDLSIININNIDKLDLAWKYKFDEIGRDIQANPIIAEDKIFLPTPGHKVVALNAKNGKKISLSDFEELREKKQKESKTLIEGGKLFFQ